MITGRERLVTVSGLPRGGSVEIDIVDIIT